MDPRPPLRLRVDLEALVDAFLSRSLEMSAFLDLATGQVDWIAIVVQREREAIRARLGTGLPEAGATAFHAALAAQALPAWMGEAVREADMVARELDTRFVELPAADSSESYEYMQYFIRTVSSHRLQERHWEVIRGRGAFRRFRDALANHPEEQVRWFTYQASRIRERALDWPAAPERIGVG